MGGLILHESWITIARVLAITGQAIARHPGEMVEMCNGGQAFTG